jgi:hypothetical protein
VLVAEGAILVLERIWPAFQAVDTSSGSLGHAVGKTVHELMDLLLSVSADDPPWEHWRERLWTAVEEDGVDYLSEVVERWGELCRIPERASRGVRRSERRRHRQDCDRHHPRHVMRQVGKPCRRIWRGDDRSCTAHAPLTLFGAIPKG